MQTEAGKIINMKPDEYAIVHSSYDDTEISQILETIRSTTTPKSQVKKRPDGYDYVEEEYMRRFLQKYFPGRWSWRGSDNPFIVTHGHIVVSGHLIVEWPNGKMQYFFSVGAARIQYRRNQPREEENVLDLDNVVAAANTNAFKRAINRLLDVAADVYQKDKAVEASQNLVEEVENLINKIPDKDKREYFKIKFEDYKKSNNGMMYEYDLERLKLKLIGLINNNN